MSVTSVSANTPQSLAKQLLLELNATGSGTSNTSNTSNATDLSSLLGDLMTLSPAAQQLTQAPAAITQAMSDLFSGQKDVQGDLAQLKSYFKENPQSLAGVLSSLQGPSATYSTSTASGSNGALLTALLNKQSSASDPKALLSLLTGTQNQNSLFAYMGDSSSAASSLFG